MEKRSDRKRIDIISFVVQLITAIFATIAVKLEIDNILNYYNANLESYNKFLIHWGNYSWYELMPYDIRVIFRVFQVHMFIIIVLITVIGIVTFHFNKNSNRLKKIIIILSSVLPIAFSAVYSLIVWNF